MTFQAPKSIPGLDAEANRALTKALLDLQNELRGQGLLVTPSKNAAYSADLLDFVRVTPPAAGLPVLLPAATVTNAGKFVLIGIESVASGGSLVLAVAGGVQKVNNAATVTVSVAGLVIAYSTGVAWVCTLLSSGGGGLTPIADDSLLANTSGAPAVPVATTFASLAGTGLSWNAALNRFDVTVTGTDPRIFAWMGV
jgi:hypothetical protein